MNKKKWIMIIIGVFIGYLATFNHVGCGAGSSSGGSSGATTAKTQLVWKNGSLGAWNGNILTGAIVIDTANDATWSSVAITDTVSAGIPSLQLSSDTFSVEWLQFEVNNAQNCSEFRNGHLQFNMRLETTDISEIKVTASNGSLTDNTYVVLSVGAFNTSQFTHASIPLKNMLGNNFSIVEFIMMLRITRGSLTPDIPLVTLNDVKWTTD
ncbi:MAG: hypothetical protein V1709_05235 [Planctomycetota bacterium]